MAPEQVEPEPVSSSASGGASAFAPSDRGDLVAPLTLVMVRHGVTPMTLEHRFSGSGVVGPSLTPAGRVQVAKAADAVHQIGRRTWQDLPSVDRVVASPMTRTQETGAAIGRRVGAHVETDARLQEVDFGRWEGLTAQEIVARDGGALLQWRDGEVAPPGGESLAQVAVRVDGLVADLAAEHARLCVSDGDHGRSIALASHAVAIKSVVGLSLEAPERRWSRLWPSPASLTIVQLRVTTDGTVAERHLLCVGAPTS
ncbi:histidine phosphatase family protein [Demequina capsici]|uniref:Histidine phosphatase family protein n=1 Tax=Demequina capsici TaxID=3075620 RepID=A0AA96JGZ0_9MICO|nr:histidine phosphatase family protein [Demequina sp. PMTSA13]WNM28439.1 histidine phosphatase family protein [Demequina sp. PMTSA13]